FFTIDAATLDAIEVLRGSASVFYGSDALGGVLLAYPVEARRDPRQRGVRLSPRGRMQLSTADHGGGFRLQVEGQIGPRLTAIAGAGYRRFGRLEASGLVRGVEGEAALVPTLIADDGELVTLGTGFGELTFDGRVSYRLGRRLVLTTSVYGYRQFDAPRTDQCPAPFAALDECLTYDEQFRTIASVALRGRVGLLHDVHVALSYQQQHERRTRTQPSLFADTIGVDDVATLGATARASSPSLRVAPDALARATLGADVYRDEVASRATLVFTDLDIERPRSRGQYLDGSDYTSLGAFGQVELRIADRLTVRGGGRGGVAIASAPGDAESGTRAVDSTYGAFVSRVGAELVLVGPTEVGALPLVSLLANADEGFRAPNLDDLTSRQQTGPGFQFENADLRPERSRTLEAGVRLTHDVLTAEAWVFHTWIRDTMVRELRGADACPPETPQCNASWSRIQLVNAAGEARLHGAEGTLRLRLPLGIAARAALSYAWGDVPDAVLGERVPLSRVPPLHGNVELRWAPPGLRERLYLGAAMRWALEQTRLAPADASDGRIPPGGTPGYTVLDLRAGARLDRFLVLNVVVENVFDTAYRVHGSSVNGPARGLVVALEGGL
ncbi:MAG: TonB-dependent receptor, partial [Deltaproteobacteria bacterium]|nr:TonB-dependent receptor [Deltaproteobacteria bacterium]